MAIRAPDGANKKIMASHGHEVTHKTNVLFDRNMYKLTLYKHQKQTEVVKKNTKFKTDAISEGDGILHCN